VSEKGLVKSAKIFAADGASKSNEAGDRIAALNQAFGKVAAEVVRWTVAKAASEDGQPDRTEPSKP
jgi:ABC-type uncharacterized transport system auxiliary subunit